MRIKQQLLTICLALMTFIGCAGGIKGLVKNNLTTPASDQYTLYARGVSTEMRNENLEFLPAILTIRLGVANLKGNKENPQPIDEQSIMV